jgi:hypothetical protein
MAETFALKEGLLLAQHAGCNRRLSSLTTWKWWKQWQTEDSRQIQQLLFMMSVILFGAGFRWSPFEHCSREANKTAHELARRGMHTKLNCNWDDEPPSFIWVFDKRCNIFQSIKLAEYFVKKIDCLPYSLIYTGKARANQRVMRLLRRYLNFVANMVKFRI